MLLQRPHLLALLRRPNSSLLIPLGRAILFPKRPYNLNWLSSRRSSSIPKRESKPRRLSTPKRQLTRNRPSSRKSVDPQKPDRTKKTIDPKVVESTKNLEPKGVVEPKKHGEPKKVIDPKKTVDPIKDDPKKRSIRKRSANQKRQYSQQRTSNQRESSNQKRSPTQKQRSSRKKLHSRRPPKPKTHHKEVTKPKTLAPKPRTVEEELFHPDPVSAEQSKQHIDPETGHATVYKRKKRPLDNNTSSPVPTKKKDFGTSPSRPFTPPPFFPNMPIVPYSPTPSGYDETENMGEDPQDDFVEPEDQDVQDNTWDDQNDPYDTYEPQPIPYTSTYHTKPSPTADTIVFNQLVDRAAKYHGVDMHTDPIEEDILFDTFPTSEKSVSTLPMLKGVLKHAPDIFKDLARARVLNPRIVKKYKSAPADPTYIRSQLPFDSLVVSNVRKRANSLTPGDAPPPDKESKML
ncbi:uncharacterized protein LOC144807809 [Lissotriton helveticus]